MEAQPIARAGPVPVFRFEMLGMLPCGCVTVTYRADEWAVSLVSVEAKGPYCPRAGHFIGQVVELGDARLDVDGETIAG